MTHLLIKLFIKDYHNTSSISVREAYGRLGGSVGIICNIFLCISKILIGVFFNSMAILADGINNLSDAGSSVITLVGFKLSSKPADEDHPFGHARIEYISGLIISFIILMLGIELVKSSITKIIHPEPITFNLLMIIVLTVSILVKLWLSFFNLHLGKIIDSATLYATATDSRNDVIATFAVLIALFISHYTQIQLDGYMGLAVGLFILYSGINIIKETSNPLLGTSPDADLIEKIENKLLSYEGVLGFHDLVLHSYGPNRYFASVHVEVSAEDDLLHSHDMIDLIERDFNTKEGIHLVIHLDPIITSDEKTNALKEQIMLLIRSIDQKLSMHDFRVVMGTTHSNIIFDVTVPIGFKQSPKELAHHIDLLVKQIDPTYYTIITVDTNYISTSIDSNE